MDNVQAQPKRLTAHRPSQASSVNRYSRVAKPPAGLGRLTFRPGTARRLANWSRGSRDRTIEALRLDVFRNGRGRRWRAAGPVNRGVDLWI